MDTKEIDRSIVLIMALFCLQPMAIGSWLALIPYVKETIGLSKSELAIALLGAPIALLIALQFAGKAVSRFGVRRLFLTAFPLQFLTAFLPLLATSQMSLFLGLAAFGFALAIMEVSLNVYAGRIEKATNRLIMNRCHGFWALGLMIGSVIAAAGASWLTPVGVMAAIAFGSALIGVWAALRIPRVGSAEEGTSPPRRRLSQMPPALFAIGTFMFLVTLTEGAMADWAAVYLAELTATDLLEAGIAVTVFSAFMAGGRFMGDLVKRKLGALMHARASVLIAMTGLLLLVVPLPHWIVFVGFAFVGIGVASGYPLGVSAVAALDDVYEAGNVAIMSTFALAGFLVGPPLIGFIAEASSLRVSFAVLIPGLIVTLYLSRWLQSQASEVPQQG